MDEHEKVSSDIPLKPEKMYKSLAFPVIGQGTFFFTCQDYDNFSILVTTERKSPNVDQYVALRLTPDSAKFIMKIKDEEEATLIEIQGSADDSEMSVGAEVRVMDTYWYSYDSLGQIIKYGKGYTMESTTLMTYNFRKNAWDKEKKDKVTDLFFNLPEQKYVRVYAPLLDESRIDLEPTFSFRSEPFVSDFPPVVLDSSKVTLFDLDRSEYMFSSSLPSACQELYANIKGLALEEPADPMMKLSDAIRYSINTKGCVLYDKLKEKSGEFGDNNQAMTYVRVTLGPDQRRGPGIPYVLEIWPSGHCSPIHNHGGACAIIKVLFGRITIKTFNKMSNPAPKDPIVLKMFDCKKGDITWISPDWYQTHQLMNRTDDFCATIQCYKYTDQDKIRYEGFDYIPTGKQKTILEEFHPDSDFTFVQLRFMVLEEYRKYLSNMTVSK